MTSDALSLPVGRTRRLGGFKPPWRVVLFAIGTLFALLAGSTAAHLAVPAPTGSHPVGRDRVVLVDASRPETHTPAAGDVRSVPLQLWYPAEVGTGAPAEYVDGLADIAAGLTASGALSSIEVAALPLVRTNAFDGATMAAGSHPVIVLSPGNETNVAFYGSLAEELASHAYLVIGVDHPFQVAATTIADGHIAVYDTAMDTGEMGSAVAAKIDERVADVIFVLDSLRTGDDQIAHFAAGADLNRIGVLGHSNGGLTAFEVCRADPTLDACLNMDGQGAGGPFGTQIEASAPPVPFLYLTKETLMHPTIGERFEAAGSSAVRAVVPDASHDSFTDGPLFQPGINPLTTSAQRVMTSVRSVTVAFFDQWLTESTDRPYDGLVAPADIYINVYPLGDLEPIPAG
jgi:predicted dienelactone hydrolase